VAEKYGEVERVGISFEVTQKKQFKREGFCSLLFSGKSGKKNIIYNWQAGIDTKKLEY
jgi:hypothetical protein